MEILDCRGQQCPQPVVQTRKLMLAQPDRTFKVLVDDDVSRDNVKRLAKSLGYTASVIQAEATFEISLTPGAAPEKTNVGTTKPGLTVIFIASDEMGRGDAKLGQILMKNFIFTLIESDTSPDAIYFVNNGVKLTVGGSDVIEPLAELASRGVDIASCGLCLEFFNVKETLAVGRISNMLELVNALEGASNIIRL
ncbi:sulfurtransferase-like selenium metabolism protein YedF [Deltaproteobacteria bacterium IMCC39524]|nr:sulfurtransferase-like selenium metabolism protein YedF [Deltaproteobacteria bacterium IMCC39524]